MSFNFFIGKFKPKVVGSCNLLIVFDFTRSKNITPTSAHVKIGVQLRPKICGYRNPHSTKSTGLWGWSTRSRMFLFRSRSTFLRFDKVGVANRVGFPYLVKLGIRFFIPFGYLYLH